jgi:hypothetical protein
VKPGETAAIVFNQKEKYCSSDLFDDGNVANGSACPVLLRAMVSFFVGNVLEKLTTHNLRVLSPTFLTLPLRA